MGGNNSRTQALWSFAVFFQSILILLSFPFGLVIAHPLEKPTSEGQKWVVVVDGYSSGSLFRSELQARKYRVAHVQSSSFIPPALAASYEKARYDAHFVLTPERRASIRDELKQMRIQAVFLGAESGIEAGDWLARELGLVGNDPATSALRRDKAAMYEATGTPAAVVRSYAEAVQAIQQKEFTWPVITKPVKSAGSEYFRISRNRRELARAIRQSLGKQDMFGAKVDALILQPRFVGREFAVNGVTWAGEPYVTDVWEYTKRTTRQGARIYDFDELMDSQGSEATRLLPFVRTKLLELGILYGAFHAEVMLTEDGGTRLIEVAARAMGSLQPLMAQRCTGNNQIALAVDAFLAPDLYRERTRKPYEVLKRGRVVELISHQKGRVVSIPLEGWLNEQTFPSYSGHRLGVKPNDFLEETVDLLQSHPGTVFLAHADGAVVKADYERLRDVEKQGIEFESSSPRSCLQRLRDGVRRVVWPSLKP